MSEYSWLTERKGSTDETHKRWLRMCEGQPACLEGWEEGGKAWGTGRDGERETSPEEERKARCSGEGKERREASGERRTHF